MSITFKRAGIKKTSSYFSAAAEFGAERVVKVTRVRTFLSASGARGRNRRSQMIKQLSAVRGEGGGCINIRSKEVTCAAGLLNLLTRLS